jgi:hypothetical protein
MARTVIGITAASVALLCVAVVLCVVTTALTLKARVRRPLAPAAPAAAALAGAGSAAALAPAALDVIPLRWDPQALVYMVTLQVGANTVDAAFDTGSALFVVATSACSSCTGALYDPAASKASLALYDPRGAKNTLCQSVIAYGSQTDTITMFRDTLTFARKSLAQPSVLCTTKSPSVALRVAGAGPTFVVDAFPVAGVTNNTGSSSLNIFGMSSVLSVSRLGKYYLLPSCQLSTQPADESAMLQAVAGYLANTAPNVDMVWSMALDESGGFFLFSALRLPCLDVCYTPLVQSLPTANSELSRSPRRYYVVRVARWVVTSNGVTRALPGAPAQLVVDTGTTNCMLPAAAAAVMSGLSGGDVAVLTLASAPSTTCAPTLTFTAASTTFGAAGIPVFSAMPDDLSQTFSSDGSVGILGATAMRGLYFEFNLTQQRLGVAYI